MFVVEFEVGDIEDVYRGRRTTARNGAPGTTTAGEQAGTRRARPESEGCSAQYRRPHKIVLPRPVPPQPAPPRHIQFNPYLHESVGFDEFRQRSPGDSSAAGVQILRCLHRR